MSAIVEHKKFSCTKLGNNNNKYWNVTLYDNDDVMSEWGRQGKTKQSKTWPGVGRSFMDKKIAEKGKKGYHENQVVEGTGEIKTSARAVTNTELKDIAVKQIKSKNPVVAKLVQFLVDVNAHAIHKATGGKITYDTSSATFKTTQGVVVPQQVTRARDLLAIMYNYVHKGQYDMIEDELDEYLSLIPRDFGMKSKSPSDILGDVSDIQKENDILDGLDASFAGLQIATPQKTTTKKTAPKIFEVDMEIVEDGKVIDRINSYYKRTKKTMHNTYRYKLKKVYEVDIKSVSDAFKNSGKKIGNIKELFHGTKCSNCLSILRGGLIIPPSSSAHCTGRLAGNGIYASDISSKALNYATNFWGRGGSTDRIFMFLCDFAMGKMYRSKGYGDYKTNRDGFDSTFMEGGKYGLQNNEMIVYTVEQVNLKYLLEFE